MGNCLPFDTNKKMSVMVYAIEKQLRKSIARYAVDHFLDPMMALQYAICVMSLVGIEGAVESCCPVTAEMIQ